MTDEKAGEEIKKLVQAAKINRLVWIDDKFGHRNSVRFARTIRNKIEVLWTLAPRVHLAHPNLAEITPGTNADRVEMQIQEILAERRANEQFPEELIDSLDEQIAEFDKTYPRDIKDLTTNQFTEIESAFTRAGARVEALSFNDWVERQDNICADLTEDDVFFVDQDFSTEEGGAATTGEEILSWLLNRPNQSFVCIFFTHAFGKSDETTSRKQIADRIGMSDKQHRFAVVSKENLTATNGGGYSVLTLAFKDAFLRDWCFSIAQSSETIIRESFAETSDALLTLDVEELAAAFFRKAFSDGTVEADVLLRVLFLAARTKIQDRRHTDVRLWKRLGNIRNLLVAIPKETISRPTNPMLQEWRERELFDPESVINENFSPVFLGDVFEVRRGNKSQLYVLIAQPCDLIIRDTGERNNTDALLLNVSDRDPKTDGFGYKFEFPKLGTLWIHYTKPIPVNLNLLDIVSFRRDGKLLFTDDLNCSELMLPGILKKFEHFKNVFRGLFKPDGERTNAVLAGKYNRLTMSSLIGGETIAKNKKIEFPLARIGRIRSPHAEAILGGFAIHHTRVAFDYNFADLSAFVSNTVTTGETA